MGINYRKELETILELGSLNPRKASYLELKAHITEFRNLVTPSMKPSVLALMSASDELTRRMGISLSKKINDDAKVKAHLLKMWKIERSVLIRCELIYRLLDYGGLSAKLVDGIHGFVETNWMPWKKFVVSWEGGADKILGSVGPKLRKATAQKDWVYLYELCFVPKSDRVKALKIVEVHLASAGKVTRIVAERVGWALRSGATF